MTIKEQLQIILITYNREKNLNITFNSLFNSPIRDYNITVLDNASTDGTQELCNNYANKYSNLQYIRNKINLGISGNIIKAMEMSEKKWLWIICDDDKYDWTNWKEIENALKQEYDIVHTTYSEGFRNETYPYIINEEAFIPTAIYNTKHITPLTMQNAYAMAYTLLPHHSIGCKVINEKGKIFVPQKRCVIQGNEDKQNFIRMPKKGLFHKLNNYNLLSSYVSAYQLIDNKNIRSKCCDVLCLGETLNKSVRFFLHTNNNNFFNIYEIFLSFNFKQKTIFIIEFLRFMLLSKNIYNNLLIIRFLAIKIKFKIKRYIDGDFIVIEFYFMKFKKHIKDKFILLNILGKEFKLKK